MKRLRIALLTTDARGRIACPVVSSPNFGTAIRALLEGFALLLDEQKETGIWIENLKDEREIESLNLLPDRYSTVDSFEIHVISCTQQPMPSPEKLAPNIWFHSLHVPKTGWLRTGYQGCIRAVRTKLREIRPDLVHGQGTERECAISAVLSGYKNVLTIHGNMRSMAALNQSRFPQFGWFAGHLESWSLPRSVGVFCNSAYTETLVSPLAKQVWRVPNAVREDFFKPQPNREKNAVPLLLNIGVVSAHKRQMEILGMAREFYAKGRRFQINFIGSCDETPYGRRFLEMLSESTEFAQHTHFLPVGKLIARFDTADALIHFPEEEAFGLVVAEALSRNLKLFGAKVGGLIDISEGVEGAELVGRDDWKALSDRIECWMESAFPRPSNASAVMAERYHPKVVAGQHLRIYREILDADFR